MSLNFNGIFKMLNHDDFKENLSKVCLVTSRVRKQPVVIFKRQVNCCHSCEWNANLDI